MKKTIMVTVAALISAALQVNADLITVDQIIYENSGGDPTALSGTVNMILSGSTLTIVLQNTSSATGVDGSFNLLTGLGFNLPGNVNITGGSVNIGGSTAVNWNAALAIGGDISEEWGYDNDPTSGPFHEVTTLSVDTVVSTMTASTDFKFQAGSLVPPEILNGPEMGLLSSAVSPSSAGGLAAIQDTVTITLTLSGNIPGGLLASIESGDVVLSFASPNSNSVPEGGSTLVMLGLALMGFVGVRRKLQK